MGRELYADWPAGELDEYHSFREKKFRYIYFCPNCSRSFETAAPTNSCKFCSGKIRRLAPIPTTEDYTVEHDMKRRAKRIMSRIIKGYLRPKKIRNEGSQKTLQEKYSVVQKNATETQKSFYMPKIQTWGIFSRRNKEELPTR